MTKVVERKLGRHKALGMAYDDKKLIEIDPRHRTNKSYMDTLIHEALHIALPEMSETRVKKVTRIIRDVMWDAGYRKVNL